MPNSTFDKFFLNLPPFDRESDFVSFWDKAYSEIKKVSLNASVQQEKTSSGKFGKAKLSYKSFLKVQITGTLLVPKKAEHPPVVIVVHDYNSKPEINEDLLDETLAYFFILLRGHGILDEVEIEAGEVDASPGYLIENILDKESYYLKAVYLDVLRAIDALRLVAKLNCAKIGIVGKGLGAAAAMFAATKSERVVALALHTPSFCYLQRSQNESDGFVAREINDYIAADKANRSRIKQNLSYFDAMNFADMINCPVLATVGFKDTISPPACVFALFNHLLCEKTIEVYPEEGNTAGGDGQMKKSLAWIKKLLIG